MRPIDDAIVALIDILGTGETCMYARRSGYRQPAICLVDVHSVHARLAGGGATVGHGDAV